MPTAEVMHDFDGNSGDGKTLAKDAGGVEQTDPTKYQLWFGAPAGYSHGFVLDGNVDFDINVRSFGGTGYIEAYLVITDGSGNILQDITPTGAFGVTFTDTSFASKTIDFGVIDNVYVGPNQRLGVKVVNRSTISTADVDIAYGVTDQPSAELRFSARDPLVVVNTNNAGAGSLRAAVNAANASGGMDAIVFDIAGGGPHVISLGGALSDIDDTVIIDGTTDPDQIVIDGIAAGGGVDGFRLVNGSDGSTIRGLVIQRFSADGVEINNSNGNTIAGNYIGVSADGTFDRGNGLDGIRIENASGNLIGGIGASNRNVISGNNIHGLRIIGAASFDNQVQGNYIGTNAAGTSAVGNSYNGVWIASGAHDNTIMGNVISGNNDTGMEIQDSATTANIVIGNFIGTDFSGTTAVQNAEGLIIEDAPDNIVGGLSLAERNIISGNALYGVLISGTHATGNVLQNNYIGVDVSGTLDLGNGDNGILITDLNESGGSIGGASNNTIGGSVAGAGNVISGNDAAGIEITGGAFNITVSGNSIGTNASDSPSLGNTEDGIRLSGGRAPQPDRRSHGQRAKCHFRQLCQRNPYRRREHHAQ